MSNAGSIIVAQAIHQAANFQLDESESFNWTNR